MPRRRSSSDSFAQLAFGDLQNLEHQLLDVGRADAGGRGFHRDGAIAERLGVEAGSFQFVRDPRVFDLLRRRQFQHHRHQQLLPLDAALGPLPQHLFKQDALVRHVLVDDPQPSRPAAMMKLS